MDIQVASNFERFLYYHLDEDSKALVAFMEDFQTQGEATLAEPPGGDDFLATAVDTADTIEAIRSVYRETGYLADPHTAVGLSAARRIKVDGPIVCIATAHPAKFPESVDAAVGAPVARHPRLEALQDLPTRRTVIPADVEAIKAFIVANT